MDKTQAAAFSYLRFIRLNGESLYAGHFFTIFFRTMRSCPVNFYMAIHTRQEYPKELIQPEIKPENYTGTTARLAQIKLNGWESGLIDEGLIKPAYPFGDCRGNNSYGGQLPMANKKINVDEKRYSDIPVWRRYTLTIEEAAGYYHIGEGKLRMLIDTHPNEDFYMMNGNRVLIKREKFERYLDHATAI